MRATESEVVILLRAAVLVGISRPRPSPNPNHFKKKVMSAAHIREKSWLFPTGPHNDYSTAASGPALKSTTIVSSVM